MISREDQQRPDAAKANGHPSASRIVPIRDMPELRESRIEQASLFETGRSLATKGHKSPRIKVRERGEMLQQIDDAPLNDAQRMLVTTAKGALLAISGPGSGKSFAAEWKVTYLVAHQVPPSRILVASFSTEAANNIRRRCKNRLEEYTGGSPDCRTLNSLGFEIARSGAEALGYPRGMRVAPSTYLDLFLERGLQALSSDALRSLDGDKPEALAAAIGDWKSRGIGPAEALASGDPLAPGYVEYQRWLRMNGCIDFDDQIRLAVVLLSMDNEAGAKARAEFGGRYDYIIVDEAQDTNRVQFAMIAILAERHGNVCVIGDDDQAIYEWRGASPENIRGFPSQWPDCKIAMLDINYRSTPQIIELANNLVSHSTEDRHEKILKPAPNKPDGSPPRVLVYVDQEDEARGNAAMVKELIESGEFMPGDFFFGFRDRFSSNLKNHLVAFSKAGISVLNTIKDKKKYGPVKRNGFALVQVISDPVLEEPAFLQLFRSPAFGVYGEDVDKLLHAKGPDGGRSLWEVMHSKEVKKTLSKEARKRVEKLCKLVTRLHAEVIDENRYLKKDREDEQPKAAANDENPRMSNEAEFRPLGDIVLDGFRELYPEDTTPELWDQKRPTNKTTKYLKQLHSRLQGFLRNPRTKTPTLASWVDFELVRLPQIIREGDAKKRANLDKSRLVVGTLNWSKGLEFTHVVIPSAIEGVIPSRRAMEDDLARIASRRRQNLLFERDRQSSGVEQERRLYYVGITRPEEQLTVTFPRTIRDHGRDRPTTPSRFIEEMLNPKKGSRLARAAERN